MNVLSQRAKLRHQPCRNIGTCTEHLLISNTKLDGPIWVEGFGEGSGQAQRQHHRRVHLVGPSGLRSLFVNAPSSAFLHMYTLLQINSVERTSIAFPRPSYQAVAPTLPEYRYLYRALINQCHKTKWTVMSRRSRRGAWPGPSSAPLPRSPCRVLSIRWHPTRAKILKLIRTFSQLRPFKGIPGTNSPS